MSEELLMERDSKKSSEIHALDRIGTTDVISSTGHKIYLKRKLITPYFLFDNHL